MLLDADVLNLQYAKIDGVEVELERFEIHSAPIREELIFSVRGLLDDGVRNATFTMGFLRDGELFELSAFVMFQSRNYTFCGLCDKLSPVLPSKAVGFTSLGGYLIAPAEKKE